MIPFESSLSLAMIEEALRNPIIKSVLAEISARLRTEVLFELQAKEASGLTPNLNSLAMQHSKGDKFLGALLPECSDTELKETSEGRILLLSAIDRCLNEANTIQTHQEFIALMKAIDGMAFVYDEWETAKNNPFHALCKEYIAPTPDEVGIRARRPDNLLATSYGIATQVGTDLVPSQTTTYSCLSGKARFFILPPEFRMQTWFEKLANQQTLGKPSLPLIASPSNATAKVLMMSQGLELFLEDARFNLDKAQIFANCVMAYLVYSGHHSFLEVAEIWNRQLDFIAIEYPQYLCNEIIPNQPNNSPYIEDLNIPERKLPYAIVGNYSQFLHANYRDEVIARMEVQLNEGLNLSFETQTRLK